MEIKDDAIKWCKDRIAWCANEHGSRWTVEKPYYEECLKGLEFMELVGNSEEGQNTLSLKILETGDVIKIDLDKVAIGTGMVVNGEELFTGDVAEWPYEEFGQVEWDKGFWVHDEPLWNYENPKRIIKGMKMPKDVCSAC